MIVKNNLNDYMLNLLSPTGEGKKLQSNSKNSFPEFKDVFSSASAKPNVNGKDSRAFRESDKFGDRRNDAFTQHKSVRTYRDVANSKKTSVADANEVDQPVEYEGSEKLDKNQKVKTPKSKAEATVDCLAQLLGMSPSDLAALLKKLNIQPEDLSEGAKIDEAVAKLSDFAGLNQDQQKMLSAVMEKISELFGPKALNVQHQSTSGGANAEALEGLGQTQQDSNSSGIQVEKVEDFSQMVSELKMKLNQLAQKFQESPLQAESELADQVESILSEGTELSNKSADALTKNGDVLLQQNPVGKVEEAGTAQANRKDASNEEGDSQEGATAETTSPTQTNGIKTTGQSSDQHPFANVLMNSTHKAEDLVRITSMQKEVMVPKSEIINQVVDKAKIVIHSDKSEMMMDLNPESLGKPSLKVVTERGMVVAKFVAESQQVKEVLEANMQLLKDSLEKQGLVVQDCSVSVGQESFRGFNQNSEAQKNARTSTHKAGAVSEGSINVMEIPENRQSNNPYEWNESNINLTA